jgi:uncharacterized protein YifE (UPF0438 family)
VTLWAASLLFLSIMVFAGKGDFTISKANAVAPTGDTSPLFFIDLGKNKPIKSQKETAFW